MKVKGKFTKFEWDSGNLDKNYLKHGVLPKETEEVFINEGSFVIPDINHSQIEERFIMIGQTINKLDLFIVFTLRSKKIRVISARKMHKKEVLKYVKFKEDTKF